MRLESYVVMHSLLENWTTVLDLIGVPYARKNWTTVLDLIGVPYAQKKNWALDKCWGICSYNGTQIFFL